MMRMRSCIIIGAVTLSGILSLSAHGMTWAAEEWWKGNAIVLAQEGAPTEVPETVKPQSWKDRLPFKLEGEIEVGGQTLSGNTGSPTLKEYRDLNGKPTIPSLRLKAEDKLGVKFLELGGTNMTRTDGFFFLHGGKYNHLQFDFDYNRQPHIIGLNRTTIFTDAGGGKFVLPPDPTQCNRVSAFNSTVASDIANSVNCLLQPTPLGHQTDTAHMGLRYLPTPNLELGADYTRINKEGTRPIGGVIGSPGSNLTERAMLRDERIHEVKAGTEYTGDWYQARFTYTGSLFDNGLKQMEWDNVCGGSPSTGTGGCRNPDPGLGRLSMMPDNIAHTFAGASGASLPWWQTRLTGSVSYSLWRQNQLFLPTSMLSGATNSSNLGTRPNAKMDVLLTNLNLTSRPLQDVTVNLRYRYYHVDNDTPSHTFTGVVVPGDSGTPTTKTNVPISFRKQNVATEAAWRITSQLTAKAGYEWEHWGRSFREAAETDEHIGKGSLDYRPLSWITGRLAYSHGVRTIGANGYVPPAFMVAAGLPQFRKYDQADRTRDKGEFFLQASPLDTVTITGTFFAQQDHFFNTSYGLQDSKAYGYSGDFTWTPSEQWNSFGGYAHDDFQSFQRNCRIPTGTPCNTTGLDDFFTKPRDILDTWHAGLNLTAVPEVLDLSIEYRYTFARSKFNMSSIPGTGTAGAEEPVPMPEIKNIFHVVNASARYYVMPQWTLKVSYLYERYTESDFTVDNITPALAATNVEGFTTTAAGNTRSVLIPIQHPAYEAHFVGFSVGYKF